MSGTRGRARVLGLSVVALVATFLVPPAAQERTMARVGREAPGRRVALVVGNDRYSEVPLKNAGKDALALERALVEVGFAEVVSLTDKGLKGLSDGIDAFVDHVRPGDVALFFYAGHGFAIEGENYLVPVDFAARDTADAKWQAYPVRRVQERLEGKGAGLVVLVLDACRNNPFRALRDAGGGWTGMRGGAGTYIAFATAPEQTASDNPSGDNGLFTTHLLEAMREPGLTVAEVFDRVGLAVQAASKGRQTPWVSAVAGVGNERIFRGAAVPPAPAPGPPDATLQAELARREEVALWESVRESQSVALLEEYLRQYPAGKYRVIAEARIGELRGGGTAPAPAPAGRRSGEAAGALEFPGATPLRFVWIEPGRFAMGSATGEADERPVHQVTLTQGFELGATEVTQGQWTAVVGQNPSRFTACGPTCPVESVSWEDVQGFLVKLNARRDGYVYRLPTEAEWEYAARAGTTGEYAGDLDALGWYDGNAGGTTHPVGTKAPNGWGLYDLHGNVWEWVADWYADSYGGAGAVTDPTGPTTGAHRVHRGGSWLNPAGLCRSAGRAGFGPGLRDDSLGFRLLRVRSS